VRLLLCHAALALSVMTLGACSSSPEAPRFFSPPHEAPAAAPLTSATLTLAPSASGQHLGDRIMWRRSDVEVGFYDQERWTQPPVRYLDQALSDSLFVAGGLRRSERGSAGLAVELVTFEEVLLPNHQVRVGLRALLVDAEGAALLEQRFAATRSVSSEDAEAMARAFGQALDEAVANLTREVMRALAKG
jgi:ABC-type uncharacterized transport system auxiliary subunit